MIIGYILRRLGLSLLVLLGAVTVTFILAHLISIDPVTAWLGKAASVSPALAAVYVKEYHLHDALYVQYFYYINGLIHLQLGYSPTRAEPIVLVISQTLPYTLQLIFIAMIITPVIGVAGGILSAKYPDGILEKVIKTSYIASTAAPPFLVPLLLLLIFASLVHAMPTSGAISSQVNLPYSITDIPMVDALIEGNWTAFLSLLQHAILPSLSIALALYGFLTRVLSSSIKDILGSNFVKAARARGISNNIILFRYGLKNSLLQVITVTALILTFALIVDVFVENIFSYPGMGQYAVFATESFDYPGILATTIVYAAMIVLVNLTADVLYFVVDPRVRHQS